MMGSSCLPPPAQEYKCAGQLKKGTLKISRASSMARFQGSIHIAIRDGHLVADLNCEKDNVQ